MPRMTWLDYLLIAAMIIMGVLVVEQLGTKQEASGQEFTSIRTRGEHYEYYWSSKFDASFNEIINELLNRRETIEENAQVLGLHGQTLIQLNGYVGELHERLARIESVLTVTDPKPTIWITDPLYFCMPPKRHYPMYRPGTMRGKKWGEWAPINTILKDEGIIYRVRE